MNRRTISIVGYVALTIVCVCGCRQQRTEYGIADGGSSWTISTEDATPGIDAASVSVITLKAGPPEGVPFVVWSDLPNGRFGSGGGKVGGASYKGHHGATDGRRIEFEAQTADGKVGTITIAEIPYDFSKGSLFLISTQDDPPNVVQLPFDTTDFPKDKDQLFALANSTSAVRTFFEEHKKKDAGDQ